MEEAFGAWQFVKLATPEVKAELFGNAVLLFTGLLGLAVTAIVTTIQLRAQREDAARDRALTLKKEVLLDAVRGAYEIQLALNAMSNDGPIEDVAAIFQSGTSKLVAASAVASLETVISGRTLLQNAAPVFMSLMVQRGPVELANMDYVILKGLVDRQIAENEKTAELKRKAITEGNEEAAAKLDTFLQQGMDTAKTLMAERQKCWQKTFELRRIYTPVVLRAQTDLDPQFRDVIASIRVEVGLDESKEAFLTATAHDANRFEGQLASMGAAIDTMAQSETQEDTPPK